MRNAFFVGLAAVLSSIAVFLGALLEYGLPLFFWAAVFYYPLRLAWRRMRALRQKRYATLPVS